MEVSRNPGTITGFKPEALGDNMPIMKMIDSKRSEITGVDLKQFISKNAKVEIPQYKTAVLRFIGNHKKFSTAYFESIFHSEKQFFYGDGFFDKKEPEKTKGKIYRISDPVKILDLTKKNDQDLFSLCCVHPSVKGSANEDAEAIWMIDIPEIKSQIEADNVNLIERALGLLRELKNSELESYAYMLSLSNADSKDIEVIRNALRKIAVTNPKMIIDVEENMFREVTTLFRKAVKKRVINKVNDVYTYNKFQLGMSEPNCLKFLQDNPDIALDITSSLK